MFGEIDTWPKIELLFKFRKKFAGGLVSGTKMRMPSRYGILINIKVKARSLQARKTPRI